MNKLENLKDLFIAQGRELYDASRQEQRELPNIRVQVRNQQLQKIIDKQLKMAKDQDQRLKEALSRLNSSPEGEKSECCESVFRTTKTLIDRSKDAEIRDAAIINSIQRLNHNKITGLGSLAAYAKQIGQKDVAKSLHNALKEEKDIDEELSDLAEKEINKLAAKPLAV